MWVPILKWVKHLNTVILIIQEKKIIFTNMTSRPLISDVLNKSVVWQNTNVNEGVSMTY